MKGSPARPSAPKQNVSPTVIILAVLALVLFIAWRAWVTFAPPHMGKLPPPPTQDIEFINQKAREAQGDFSRLSPEDQMRVQRITQGFGPAAIASAWRKQQQGRGGSQ